MAQSSLTKSTIDRLVRSAFRALELAAPALGARWAERLWFTLPASAPGARPTQLDDRRAADPLAPGAQFEVTLRGRVVRGRTWGDGPVVYLVHGWAGTGDQLAPFVAPLVADGYRVVAFDGLSHGRSDPGVDGPRSSHAVELGRSLDAVAARFGPARAVVAHSLGSLATLLALRDGWLATERLVLIAPVEGVPEFLQRLRTWFGFGDRIQVRLAERARRRTGYAVEDLDVALLGAQLDTRPELLVIHDLKDRETFHAASARLVASWPGAHLISTTGLGHVRVLRDPAVGRAVVDHVAGRPLGEHLESEAGVAQVA